MHEERSLLFIGAYWLFLIAALAISYFALREVWLIREQTLMQVRVVERTVQMKVRMVSSQKSSAVRNPFLFAKAQLRLERLDTHAVIRHTEEKRLDENGEFVTHQFLDHWPLGKAIPAVERDGVVELNPGNPWMTVLAFAVGAWMIGAVAWMLKPFAEGIDSDTIGRKLLVLAVVPIGVMVIGLVWGIRKDRQEEAVERVAVEGRRKEISIAELLAELAGMGVKAGDDVKKHLGNDERTLDYCEFAWSGKTWRTASLSCQGPEGVSVAGRLNPSDPRNVKWGAEPEK